MQHQIAEIPSRMLRNTHLRHVNVTKRKKQRKNNQYSKQWWMLVRWMRYKTPYHSHYNNTTYWIKWLFRCVLIMYRCLSCHMSGQFSFTFTDDSRDKSLRKIKILPTQAITWIFLQYWFKTKTYIFAEFLIYQTSISWIILKLKAAGHCWCEIQLKSHLNSPKLINENKLNRADSINW